MLLLSNLQTTCHNEEATTSSDPGSHTLVYLKDYKILNTE